MPVNVPRHAVSRAVEIIARQTGMPWQHVNNLASFMIREGYLPKAVGRRIPEIHASEFGSLILATLASQSTRSGPDAVEQYSDLPPQTNTLHLPFSRCLDLFSRPLWRETYSVYVDGVRTRIDPCGVIVKSTIRVYRSALCVSVWDENGEVILAFRKEPIADDCAHFSTRLPGSRLSAMHVEFFGDSSEADAAETPQPERP